jgi:hypothetical protein
MKVWIRAKELEVLSMNCERCMGTNFWIGSAIATPLCTHPRDRACAAGGVRDQDHHYVCGSRVNATLLPGKFKLDHRSDVVVVCTVGIPTARRDMRSCGSNYWSGTVSS